MESACQKNYFRGLLNCKFNDVQSGIANAA
jgi:hypothetical protein